MSLNIDAMSMHSFVFSIDTEEELRKAKAEKEKARAQAKEAKEMAAALRDDMKEHRRLGTKHFPKREGFAGQPAQPVWPACDGGPRSGRAWDQLGRHPGPRAGTRRRRAQHPRRRMSTAQCGGVSVSVARGTPAKSK